MVAFNVVRMRVRPGCEQEYLALHSSSAVADMPGMRRAVLIKTGDRSFCLIGEWDDMDALAAARPTMISQLDRMRPLLESQGESGVTDPVSGDVVAVIR
jgi:quinol monooxygenase YgiN